MADVVQQMLDLVENQGRLIEQSNAVVTAQMEELSRLRAALREILDPISGMRARMNVADGEALNGPMAIGLSNNPNYLKEIARAALSNKGDR
ncbi:hypothetical protein ELG76_03945 [Rhizobium leguminosarum]|uniref:hypothetical protein n=1 Tax=Rhizobium leguminosarum TaxID=384 RepID=UPI001030E875|nr:hypothetical protein [Rhizobium leguminosarum]TBG78573.1 hypothetical protein ELG76_03945 [Rhizobium leguminosarum]